MSLFNKPDATVPVTGTDILRLRLKSFNKTPNALARIASDIKNIGVGHLESFINGGDLPAEAKRALARSLWNNTVFDSEADRLVTLLSAAQPVCSAFPPVYDPRLDPNANVVQHDPNYQMMANPPVQGNQQPMPAKRPGFA